MSVFKPRTRIVSFRLSEDEYEGLRGPCVSQGVRSISEFARFATRQWISSEGEPALATLMELDKRVRVLDLELRKLVAKTHPRGAER